MYTSLDSENYNQTLLEFKQGKTNLTEEQLRLWFLLKLEPEMPNNILTQYVIDADLEIAALQQAISTSIDHFEIFNVNFTEVLGNPVRKSTKIRNSCFIYHDLTEKTNQPKLIEDLINAEQRSNFNISSGPLIKIILLKADTSAYTLILKLSKFVADHTTADLFAKDIFSRYTHLVSGGNIWENTLKQSPELLFKLEKDLQSTTNIQNSINSLKTDFTNIPYLQLPEDYKRPAVKTHKSSSITVAINKDQLSTAKEFCASNNNIEIKHFLFAVYNILLYRYTQQNYFCSGILIDKREKLAQPELLGNLANILPIKFDISDSDNIINLCSAIKTQEQQDAALISFKTLVENITIDRDLSRTPLIQTLFTFTSINEYFYQTNYIRVRKVFMISAHNDYEITFNIAVHGDGLKIRIDYDYTIFHLESIHQLANCYCHLLKCLLENPQADISLIPLLSEDDKKNILSVCGPSFNRLPIQTLDEIIDEQVSKTPDAIAVYYKNQSITYKSLNAQANRLANYLTIQNLHQCTRIGLFLDRSIDTIIAILAILKSGCAYVPIDTSYPEERIKYMLNDSEIEIVITKNDLINKLHLSELTIINLDTDHRNISQYSSELIHRHPQAKRAAYLMYTSGSTGKSKAVIVRHDSVVNNIFWRQKCWPLTSNDRILLNSSFSFDPSIWSIFWTLSSGAAIVIVPSELQSDINALIALIQEKNISLIGTVPSIIALLVNEPEFTNCRSLRYLLSGGEALSSALQEKIYLRTSAQLVNVYGPTETTIDATYFITSKETMHLNAKIGKPIANKQVYILDENMQLLPRGVTGEIFIGGAGVARGYYNRPALTAESFLPDPFSTIPGSRLYRTGDMGKLSIDGNIEFIGRRDDQVKIRGFRIELTEVEKALYLHPNIKEATLIISHESLENARMIAFIVPHKNDLTYPEVITFLKLHLPTYMLPNMVINLEALPTLPNGKINRQALLQHKLEQVIPPIELRSPVNKTQEIVRDYFIEVLGVNSINIDEDFFELGGTSLLLSRLASYLYKYFNVEIPLHQFFKVPTIEGIADVITLYNREGINAIMMEKHIVKLVDDAILDPMITSAGKKVGNYTNPKTIFITGVTGYLGAFLLKSLLDQSDAVAYCLIRANHDEHAYERIKEVMQGYHIWDENYKSRINIVCGDLAETAFGLTTSLWDILAKEIDVIYHCGALVNFAYPYSALRAANVQGTKEILRLACDNHLKAIHYVSTIDVLLATHTERPFLEDDAPLRSPADIAGGYTASKWVAEKLMHTASERGMPVCIYRPGLIMSHTLTGATQTNDYILVAFRGFVPMKIMPDYARIFDIVPVDYVADAITGISMQKNCYGKFYHLFNPAPVTLFQFCEWTKTYGYLFKIVPFAQGREEALKVDDNHPLYPLVPLIRDADTEPQRSLDPRFMDELHYDLECKNTLEALSNTPFSCPPMSEELTHLCIQYLISIDFLPSPSILNSTTNNKESCYAN